MPCYDHDHVEAVAPSRAGGDGWAANAGVGLIQNGQPPRKRKLSCESSDAGLTGKADSKNDNKNNNTSTKGGKRKTSTGGERKKRRTKWNVEPGLSVVRKAIYLFRNGVGNSVQIERLLQVPARTLRRYVSESMDPTNKLFFMPETPHERRGRELQEAGERHGVYSRKSFEAAVRLQEQEAQDEAHAAAAGAGVSSNAKVVAANSEAVVRLTDSSSPVVLELVPTSAAETKKKKKKKIANKRLKQKQSATATAPRLVAATSLGGPIDTDVSNLDFEGTLNALENGSLFGGGGGGSASTTTASSSAKPATLDFATLEFFSDFASVGAGLDMVGGFSPLTPTGAAAAAASSIFTPTSPAPASATAAEGRDRGLSLGSLLDEFIDLPVPTLETPRAASVDAGANTKGNLIRSQPLDVDATKDAASNDALLKNAWEQQRPQLMVGAQMSGW